MKNLFLLFAALSCISANIWSSPNPAVVSAHKTTHKIKMFDLDGDTQGSCSATAIGPHAILTASHCISVSAVINVDGKDADVMGTIGDGLDHTIVLLNEVDFKDYANVSDTQPQQAEEVFVFGNPAGMPDMFRHGYVSGFNHIDDDSETIVEELLRPRPRAGNEAVRITYYDFNGFFGDSGSAIFDRDGNIIAVTSFIYGGQENGFELKFMGSYELRLTREQLKQAREYNPPPVQYTPDNTKKFNILDFFFRK